MSEKEEIDLAELLETIPATVGPDGKIILALSPNQQTEPLKPNPPNQKTHTPKLLKPVTKSLGVEEMIHRANLYRANLADS